MLNIVLKASAHILYYTLRERKRKTVAALEKVMSVRSFQPLSSILQDCCFFFIFVLSYMFFTSYFVHVSFKSELIKKRALSNHSGFLGYRFFIFLISIICDCIIRFSVFTLNLFYVFWPWNPQECYDSCCFLNCFSV